jgi:phosphinothricin acetyltransferase
MELYRVLENCLAAQGYQLLYALVTQENEASIRFHQKAGYFLRAAFPDCAFKFGKNLGVNWMEKRLKSVENPGHFPTPWSRIVQDVQKSNDILCTLSLS